MAVKVENLRAAPTFKNGLHLLSPLGYKKPFFLSSEVVGVRNLRALQAAKTNESVQTVAYA